MGDFSGAINGGKKYVGLRREDELGEDVIRKIHSRFGGMVDPRWGAYSLIGAPGCV